MLIRPYYIFGNLSMIVYMNEIQKPKFANISFREFDQFGPGRTIEFPVYFHPVGYIIDVAGWIH